MFHCLGTVTGSSKSFHNEGFLKSNCKCSIDENRVREPNFEITLFGTSYLFSSALIEHGDDLFEELRKSFLLLNSNVSTRGLRPETADNTNCTLRNDISFFMNYVLYFLKFTDTNYHESSFLNFLDVQLSRSRLLFHKMSFAKLPDHTLAYYASSMGDSCSSPSQYVVHCHFDFRWIFINILNTIDQIRAGSISSQFTQDAKNVGTCVEEEILLLMNELVWLSIVRYEKADKLELASFPAFSCVCVKELWLLLLFFPYSSQDFWVYFHQTLKVILENKEPPVDQEYYSLKVAPPDFLPCSNRNEFALWFLADISRLLEYSPNGEHLGANASAGDKFEVVDDVLRGLLSEEAGPSEASMRNLLPLVSKIQSSCGHLRSGPILCLWEYFFKKLNSAFYIPGSKLNSNIVISQTGLALVEDVKSRLDGSARDKRENSFFMFLRLLGEHLLAVQRTGASSTRLCSRVFIKFSASRPEKLKEMLEPGVFHLSSLYLTLALGSATPAIINRLVELLASIPRTDHMKETKHEMVFKAYAACLIALEEMNSDLSESAVMIVKHVDWCLSHPLLTPLVHFTDALKHLFQRDISRIRGLHLLLQPWIPLYLNNCRKSDTCRFLSIFTPLLEKLKMSSGSYVSEGQQLRTKVENYLIPCLSEYESPTTAELAALCALYSPKYKMEIFRYWSEKEDCTMSGKFLAVMVRYGGPNLSHTFPQLSNYLLLVWARCCFIWGENEDTRSLTLSVQDLPQSATIKIDWNSSQHFKAFIDFFGVEYSLCQSLFDKSSLRTLFQSFFPKFDKWMDNQCKTLEQLEGDTADRFYDYSSYLFVRCPHLIYTKSNPQCLLKIIMDYLVLPRQIYKPEYKVPPRVFAAITRNLHGFINGLLALGCEQDPYIGRLLRDVLTHYLPRLRSVPIENNPILLSLNENSSSFLLTVLKSFLKVQNGSVEQNANHVLQILNASIKPGGNTALTIFQGTAESVVELMIMLDDLHPTKDKALNFISIAMDSPCNRKRMYIVLSDLCKKYMAFKGEAWFNATKRITPLCRVELAALVPLAKKVVEEVEEQRKVDCDPSLRRLLQNLELAVG